MTQRAAENEGLSLTQATAESLIAAYGDQAYYKGLRLAVEALRCGDPSNSRMLSQANLELRKRGYHKFKERI